MRKFLNLKKYSLVFFIIPIFMASCNDNGSEKKADETIIADTSTKDAAPPPAPKAAVITGTLDNLWVEAADFKNLKTGKLVFSFVFRTNDTLTLYGWICKGGLVCAGNYDPYPAIKLKKATPTNVKYGPEVIFGNMILKNAEVNKIQNKIGAKYAYVVFVPENDGEFIKYTIYVSNDDPASVVKTLALDSTGVIANPSPPKEY